MNKKFLSTILLGSALLSLSACGNKETTEEMQDTINSQSDRIEELKKENATLKSDNNKLSKENKEKDKQIAKQKKSQTNTSIINTTESTNAITTTETSQSFANEAEANAYYDAQIDHESIARSAQQSEEAQQAQNVREAQSMAQSAEKEGRKITSAEMQTQWLKEQGLL